ncbi:MAG: hypothetical protein CMQ29_03770 [Gammaproteobacteria bacterium]|nr:hypothetical protein [Gammaproteobacteria bacterium]
MFKPLTFEPATEGQVRFIEETDPDVIVEKTVERLRTGTSVKEILTASTLAVVRSTDIPPQHHGGPLHPVCGVRAVSQVAQRLAGEDAFLPILQHVALANNHCHSLQMGPYLMPELAPMAGKPGDIGSFHITDQEMTDGLGDQTESKSREVEATKGAFFKSLRAMQAPAAEHYFLWLLDNVAGDEALDQLLPLAISRNGHDDHNFLYPVYTARALDEIGWEWAHVLFRPVVRFQARPAPRLLRNDYDFEDIRELIRDRKLLEREIAERTTPAEVNKVRELGMQMGRNKKYLENCVLIADAVADGLSIEGAGQAMSIGAAAAYISTSYGNPMDAHLHTGANNRRFLLEQPNVSLEHKLMGLMTAFTGPEVLLAERLLNWEENLDGDVTAKLPSRGQDALLNDIVDSIEGQPWLDWRKIGVAATVAPDEVKETVALARQYAENGYDAEPYFNRLAEIACRDDFTEMHSLKHFQAIVDEFYRTPKSSRWVHLVAAAKSAAVIHLGREHAVYEQAKSLIAA